MASVALRWAMLIPAARPLHHPLSRRDKVLDETDTPQIIPSGTPVVGADDVTVGHAVAVEPGGLLVEQAAGHAGDASLLHVPRAAVVDTSGGAVHLAVTGDELEAGERARRVLGAKLQEAHLTPDRVGMLQAILDQMRIAPDERAWASDAPLHGFAERPGLPAPVRPEPGGD